LNNFTLLFHEMPTHFHPSLVANNPEEWNKNLFCYSSFLMNEQKKNYELTFFYCFRSFLYSRHKYLLFFSLFFFIIIITFKHIHTVFIQREAMKGRMKNKIIFITISLLKIRRHERRSHKRWTHTGWNEQNSPPPKCPDWQICKLLFF
jgi:hypothetical protein